jgi:hypothetical protein
MKYTQILLLFLALMTVSGCINNDESTNQSKEKSEKSEKSDPVLIQEHSFGLGTDSGESEFYRYQSLNNIGTYEIGPINFNVEGAEAVQGSFTNDNYEGFSIEANETIDMVNFHIRFELIKGIDDFTFNEKHLHLITEDGEEIERPHELLSSVVNASILKSTKKSNESFLRQFSFRLKESTAEEIEEATLIIDPPVDNNGDSLGEQIEIEVDFSKSED